LEEESAVLLPRSHNIHGERFLGRVCGQRPVRTFAALDAPAQLLVAEAVIAVPLDEESRMMQRDTVFELGSGVIHESVYRQEPGGYCLSVLDTNGGASQIFPRKIERTYDETVGALETHTLPKQDDDPARHNPNTNQPLIKLLATYLHDQVKSLDQAGNDSSKRRRRRGGAFGPPYSRVNTASGLGLETAGGRCTRP
jgi:hypothetical protein